MENLQFLGDGSKVDTKNLMLIKKCYIYIPQEYNFKMAICSDTAIRLL